MRRVPSEGSRLKLLIPDIFVVPQKKPPEPPPVPGTVRPEDIREPTDPPIYFLKPWKSHDDVPRSEAAEHRIPCEVDIPQLHKYLQRHDVEGTIRGVFKDASTKAIAEAVQTGPAPANPQLSNPENEAIVQDVLKSLEAPFCGSDQSSICWTHLRCIRPNPTMDTKLGGKKLKTRHKILRGPPWSIVTYADPTEVRRNIIYDGNGDAIAQVDFGHGQAVGIHVHALVRGNLEHTAGNTADHAWPLETVPWPWLAIPDLREGSAGVAAAKAGGDDGKESDDDNDGTSPAARGLALQNTPTTIDDCKWIAIDVAFEDYLGDGQFSDEW